MYVHKAYFTKFCSICAKSLPPSSWDIYKFSMWHTFVHQYCCLHGLQRAKCNGKCHWSFHFFAGTSYLSSVLADCNLGR